MVCKSIQYSYSWLDLSTNVPNSSAELLLSKRERDCLQYFSKLSRYSVLLVFVLSASSASVSTNEQLHVFRTKHKSSKACQIPFHRVYEVTGEECDK